MSSPKNPIVAPAVIPEEEAEPRSLKPQGWLRPKGYANGMTARGRVVLTGGVVGWDAMGQFPEGFVPQARRCFHNIRAVESNDARGRELAPQRQSKRPSHQACSDNRYSLEWSLCRHLSQWFWRS